MKSIAAILAIGALALPSAVAGQFGTAFAISPKGYLVTCHHVVRGAERILVHSGEGRQPAHIIALDPRNDLAVLKVKEWNGRFLGLAPRDEITYASKVTAAGFPDPTLLGVNPKISQGIVNALSGVRDDPRYLQISAPIQPGNSGGPLLSSSGRVVGIVAAGLDSVDRMRQGGYLPQAVNYAIKADLIEPLLENASVPTPIFGTRTRSHVDQMNRALASIALIEGLEGGETLTPIARNRRERPSAQPRPPRAAPESHRNPPPSAGPWIFPRSGSRPLRRREVAALSPEQLWRARNEIYLRRGFRFTTPRGRRFAAGFAAGFPDTFRPSTPSVEAVQRRLTPVEVANLRLIAALEGRPDS